MNSHWRLPALLSALALFALAPTAQASWPNFSNNKIEINKQIGGVKLGAGKASGVKAWGKKGSRCEATFCQWDTGQGYVGYANFSFVRGNDISAINLDGSYGRDGKARFPKQLRGPKTSKGIGIGSKKRALKKAYPKAKDLGTAFRIKKGRRETFFQIDKATKKVRQITMTETPR